ncbi:MAG: preprotein translocase subunit SecE [SAR324 cluster bacterium]|nr:preprotein translocase subunit SecE [SAR324 cluster bacterium]
MWVRVPPGLLQIISWRIHRSAEGRRDGEAINNPHDEEATVGLFRGLKSFLTGVRSEFKRVSWPTREATLQSTGVVCFVTIVVAIYLGLVDLGLSEAVKFFIR